MQIRKVPARWLDEIVRPAPGKGRRAPDAPTRPVMNQGGDRRPSDQREGR
jgi:hypothetical protein